jgi:hypothetical protein
MIKATRYKKLIDILKNNLESKNPKIKKTIDVKGGIVKGKTSIYTRDPHKRLANVNAIDPKKSKHP